MNADTATENVLQETKDLTVSSADRADYDNGDNVARTTKDRDGGEQGRTDCAKGRELRPRQKGDEDGITDGCSDHTLDLPVGQVYASLKMIEKVMHLAACSCRHGESGIWRCLRFHLRTKAVTYLPRQGGRHVLPATEPSAFPVSLFVGRAGLCHHLNRSARAR